MNEREHEAGELKAHQLRTVVLLISIVEGVVGLLGLLSYIVELVLLVENEVLSDLQQYPRVVQQKIGGDHGGKATHIHKQLHDHLFDFEGSLIQPEVTVEGVEEPGAVVLVEVEYPGDRLLGAFRQME